MKECEEALPLELEISLPQAGQGSLNLLTWHGLRLIIDLEKVTFKLRKISD
jgi:hypothetical protein